jgi:lipid-A-disaccharide synthase
MNGHGRAIGIIAGGGSLPFEVAQSIVDHGGRVHIVMVEGAADPSLAAFPHTVVNWAEPGRATTALKREGIRDIVMLGGYYRPSLATARPDLTFFRGLPSVVRLLRAGGDDAVLRGLVALFERQGFNVIGVADVADDLLIGDGALTKAGPSPRDAGDIAKGFALIAALGRYDIGQAAVVTEGRIEAIEGAEGTDRMLKRVALARNLSGKRERRGVLVKRPKPGQDLRVDVPAIGPNTIRNADEASLAGIAVMSGHVLAAERPTMLALADRKGLFVVGVLSEAGAAHQQSSKSDPGGVTALGSLRIGALAQTDMTRAAGILNELAAFETGSAVVIDGGRVIAVGASEPANEVISRAAGLRKKRRRRRGIAAVGPAYPSDESVLRAAAASWLEGVLLAGAPLEIGRHQDIIRLADSLGMIVASLPVSAPASGETNVAALKPGAIRQQDLRIFLVAGEHSGDALGGKLIAALKSLHPGPIHFAGVGGEEMTREGLSSLFPLEDVAVMGPISILPRLPRIIRRVYQTVDAAVAFAPDIVVVIDSPEFTHPIARRIRKRAPDIPIVDYVSPSVWAWRPGRAKRMRPYVDHILALLPFEPEAHARLGGPPCTYVGHPLIERLGEIEMADGAQLGRRLGIAPEAPVLVVLPGSRTSEVDRLIDVFGEAIAKVADAKGPIAVVIPAVRHLRNMIDLRTKGWKERPHLIDAGNADKYAAMRLARAALAASGTVTLELALAQTPGVVAYKVDWLIAKLRFLVQVPSVVLANLVLGRNVYPEFLQEACTPENLGRALSELLSDTPARKAQVEALAETPEIMRHGASSPSTAAAKVVLSALKDHAAGKSRRVGPT